MTNNAAAVSYFTLSARYLVLYMSIYMFFRAPSDPRNAKFWTCITMRMNKYHNESAACYLIEKYLDQKANAFTITRVFRNVTSKRPDDHPIEYRFFRSYILIKIFLGSK